MKVTLDIGYQNARLAEYPPITDLADALVHQSMTGDDTKLKAYLTACKAVKERYPKPTDKKGA